MLACNETVTLVRCDGEVYATCQIIGASWYDKTQVVQATNGLQHANVAKIRIPADVADALPMMPEVGDHVIHGALAPGERIATAADLNRHHPRRVMSTAVNYRGLLPHIAVIAQ